MMLQAYVTISSITASAHGWPKIMCFRNGTAEHLVVITTNIPRLSCPFQHVTSYRHLAPSWTHASKGIIMVFMRGGELSVQSETHVWYTIPVLKFYVWWTGCTYLNYRACFRGFYRSKAKPYQPSWTTVRTATAILERPMPPTSSLLKPHDPWHFMTVLTGFVDVEWWWWSGPVASTSPATRSSWFCIINAAVGSKRSSGWWNGQDFVSTMECAP